LVAFSSDGEHHLVFVEAKGVTNWSTSQMKSKAARLRTLFGENGDARKENGVVPHFVYTSPRQNSKLDLSSWPSWMRNDGSTRYIPLSVEEDLLAVARCNEDGIEMRGGKYWKIRQRNG
jgi:hypothetical protein